jgi:hypothetical protein
MQEYIATRTPADKQPIPPQLKDADNRAYTVSVTLRKAGAPVGTGLGSGGGVARNTVEAALKAMRSPALGNRVTPNLLSSLTVEVEVLGPPQVVSELGPQAARGLVGWRQLGQDKPPVLPSAVVLGVAAAPTATTAPAGTAGAGGWDVFATRHFVGYADGRVVELVRGKLLLPPDRIDEQTLRTAATRVALAMDRPAQSPWGGTRPAATIPASGPALAQPLSPAAAALAARLSVGSTSASRPRCGDLSAVEAELEDLVRVGSPASDATATRQAVQVVQVEPAAPDEAGGWAVAGQGEPAVTATALAVVRMTRRLAAAEGKQRQRLEADILAARRFCCQMIYKSADELYFAAEPAGWLYAVRGWPSAGRPSPEAAVAALIALTSTPAAPASQPAQP